MTVQAGSIELMRERVRKGERPFHTMPEADRCRLLESLADAVDGERDCWRSRNNKPETETPRA